MNAPQVIKRSLIAVLVFLALLTAETARAQACVCSRNVALPTGVASRPGSITLGLDYTLAQSGGERTWRGFAVIDRGGNSMEGMAMPGHIVQTATLDLGVGLPKGFSVSTSVPYLIISHLAPSEMPGDVNTHWFGDMSLGVRWGFRAKDEKTFVGFGVGATLPTGKTSKDAPMRTGRGTLGGVFSAQAMRKVSPLAGLAASVSFLPNFYAPADGYRVGSSGSAALGTRFTIRENGRLMFSTYGVMLYQSSDFEGDYRYEHTGLFALDVSAGATWTFWEKNLRSAALLARGEIPLWQSVGDPWLAENFSVSAGISVIAF